MIAKMSWPLIQVKLSLMFCINEIPISLQQDKKRFYDFFRVKLQPFMKYHSPSLFSVTQQHEIDHTWPSLTFFWRSFFFFFSQGSMLWHKHFITFAIVTTHFLPSKFVKQQKHSWKLAITYWKYLNMTHNVNGICFLRSLVVTYLRLETKGLRFESCC